MIGKVIVGIAIAVLTGGLVIGAMNRTSSREADGNRFNQGKIEAVLMKNRTVRDLAAV